MKRAALFLDRDGVINVDHGYVHKAEDFEFIDGIFDLVRAANRQGLLTIVITNQAGIGRGFYSEDDFKKLTGWMKQEFRRFNAQIDDVYFCPFHPIHGLGKYRQDHECRKPRPGMLLQAAREHEIELGRSILIGDKRTDIQAGQAAGVGTLILLQGEVTIPSHATHSVRNLKEAQLLLEACGNNLPPVSPAGG